MSDFIANEDDAFLSELPYDILLDCIENQFESPADDKKRDFVDLYFKRYQLMKDNSLDDDVIELDEEKDDFIRSMAELFEDHLHIGLNVLDETADDDEIQDTITMTFRFFINRIEKNFSNAVFNYIEENIDRLVEKYGKNKDVTTASFKNMIADKNVLSVVSNVGYITDEVIDELRDINDIDYFFKLCEGNKLSVELEYVKEAFDDMRLTGNFMSSYVNKLNDDTIGNIKIKVRKKFIKKYGKQK